MEVKVNCCNQEEKTLLWISNPDPSTRQLLPWDMRYHSKDAWFCVITSEENQNRALDLIHQMAIDSCRFREVLGEIFNTTDWSVDGSPLTIKYNFCISCYESGDASAILEHICDDVNTERCRYVDPGWEIPLDGIDMIDKGIDLCRSYLDGGEMYAESLRRLLGSKCTPQTSVLLHCDDDSGGPSLSIVHPSPEVTEILERHRVSSYKVYVIPLADAGMLSRGLDVIKDFDQDKDRLSESLGKLFEGE